MPSSQWLQLKRNILSNCLAFLPAVCLNSNATLCNYLVDLRGRHPPLVLSSKIIVKAPLESLILRCRKNVECVWWRRRECVSVVRGARDVVMQLRRSSREGTTAPRKPKISRRRQERHLKGLSLRLLVSLHVNARDGSISPENEIQFPLLLYLAHSLSRFSSFA